MMYLHLLCVLCLHAVLSAADMSPAAKVESGGLDARSAVSYEP
jgi:hypothetical protein